MNYAKMGSKFLVLLQILTRLTCGNIFKEFLLIYTCGIIDLGKRDEPALSEQFLETDTSNERKES